MTELQKRIKTAIMALVEGSAQLRGLAGYMDRYNQTDEYGYNANHYRRWAAEMLQVKDVLLVVRDPSEAITKVFEVLGVANKLPKKMIADFS